MKLCIYSHSADDIYRLSHAALNECGFRISTEARDLGTLTATRDCKYPLPVAWLDVRIQREKYAVTVTVISSHLSVRFGNFSYNAGDEARFVECLLNGLRHVMQEEKYRHPVFTIQNTTAPVPV